MTSKAERLRAQAARCLRLAIAAADAGVALRLRALAADYLEQVQVLERG